MGRARYERRPERQRGLKNYDSGMRNGFRPRRLQTAEGELRIEIPQARETAQPFVSKLFPKWHCKRLLRTDPLKALIIGGFVRGLSMRDVESLCEEAGLGRTSRSTVSRVCAELHERFEAFCRRWLYDVNLVVLFLDAIYLPVRPSGPKEGVICAWGITENGERALVSVRLGDARDQGGSARARPRPHQPRAPGATPGRRRRRGRAALGGRGDLAAARTASTAPFTASGTCWRSCRSQEHDRIRFNYWAALTDATSVKDGKLRLQVLISELDHGGYESAARCLADDLDALVVHLRYPLRRRERWRSTNLLERSLGEVRRRTKVIGRFPGETGCLSLVWAVLDLFFSHASNGATFTDVDRQHLYRIKYQQAGPRHPRRGGDSRLSPQTGQSSPTSNRNVAHRRAVSPSEATQQTPPTDTTPQTGARTRHQQGGHHHQHDLTH